MQLHYGIPSVSFADSSPLFKGEPLARPALINYIRFVTAFQGKPQKNCLPANRPGDRWEMYTYAFSLCEAVKRFRMAANWQRVAVPVGRSLPSVPLMRPWPTAHCMAGTA